MLTVLRERELNPDNAAPVKAVKKTKASAKAAKPAKPVAKAKAEPKADWQSTRILPTATARESLLTEWLPGPNRVLDWIT